MVKQKENEDNKRVGGVKALSYFSIFQFENDIISAGTSLDIRITHDYPWQQFKDAGPENREFNAIQPSLNVNTIPNLHFRRCSVGR